MGRYRNSEGFTLVETLVTLVIMGIVGIALFQMLNVSQGSVEDQKATLEAQQNARVALNAIAEDFRHVSYGKDATQPSIYYADFDSVVFVADIFHDVVGAEVISYYLAGDGDGDTPNPNDRILMKTVTDTTGAVLVDAPQSYGMAQSGLQLRYYNGNGVELPSPVSQPETIGEISVVVSGVSPRPLQSGDYYTVTLSTTIYPRNLPLTPARSRPNPPIFTGTSVPNCEAVTLSWDPPTTNTDGTDLEFNDISHFNFYMGSSPSTLNLSARLARTISEWTVADLTGGEYYFGITCVSRAGVESYPYETDVDLSAGFIAAAPENFTTTTTATGIDLDWDPVSQFEDGESITTPVYYKVYRGDNPGFTADETSLHATTADGVLNYHDGGLSGCSEYYYKIAAVACDNDGAPSDAQLGLYPAPVACVSDVDATLGVAAGEVLVSWQAPTTRQDGTSLLESDLDHYYVYHDTIPGSYADSTLVPAGTGTPPTSWLLTGLVPCKTYYMNVRAVDDCGNQGDLCMGNELVIATSSPCTPGPPAGVTGLLASVGDDRMLLKWDANTTDCDLRGYRVYYGYTPGGPYEGVGAWEGDSPIEVEAADVTSGELCSFELNGLDLCADYYVVVTAIDQCTPVEEGDRSTEIVGGTSCVDCNVVAACSPWVAYGDSYHYVRVPIHDDGGRETVTRMQATWPSGSELAYVWAGDTLVWGYDGSAGDGAGFAGSGHDLEVEPFEIPDWASDLNMFYLTMKFTGDMRNADMDVSFWAGGAPCNISGLPKPALLLDDFEDGDYNGWTVDTGNWVVDGGVLAQTNNAGGSKWIYTSALNWGDDFVFEAATQIATGGYSILQFNRYASGYRYVGLLYYWGQTANIASMLPGYTDLAYSSYSFNEGEWHKVRVEMENDVE